MKLIRLLFAVVILVSLGLIFWQKANQDKASTAQPIMEVEVEDELKLNPNAISIAFLGNTSKNSASANLVDQIAELSPDAVVHLGNLGISTEENFKTAFNQNFGQLNNFLPSIGEQDLSLKEDILDQAKLSQSYYSKDFSNIHLIALDSNLLNNEERADEMISWLKNDLADLTSNQISIVYFFHSAISSNSLYKPSEAVRQQIVPVLNEVLVDFVITAENHNYQRSCPLNLSGLGEVCTSPGTLHIISGGGGAPLHGFTGEQESIIKRRAKGHHFVLIEVENQEIHLRAIDLEGKTLDDVELVKKL